MTQEQLLDIRQRLVDWRHLGEPVVPDHHRQVWTDWDSQPLLGYLAELKQLIQQISDGGPLSGDDVALDSQRRQVLADARRLEMIWKMQFTFADRLYELDGRLLRRAF